MPMYRRLNTVHVYHYNPQAYLDTFAPSMGDASQIVGSIAIDIALKSVGSASILPALLLCKNSSGLTFQRELTHCGCYGPAPCPAFGGIFDKLFNLTEHVELGSYMTEAVDALTLECPSILSFHISVPHWDIWMHEWIRHAESAVHMRKWCKDLGFEFEETKGVVWFELHDA